MKTSIDNSKNRVISILRDNAGNGLSAVSIAEIYQYRYGRRIQHNTVEKNIHYLIKDGCNIIKTSVQSGDSRITKYSVSNVMNSQYKENQDNKKSIYDISCSNPKCRASGFYWHRVKYGGNYICGCGTMQHLSKVQLFEYNID